MNKKILVLALLFSSAARAVSISCPTPNQITLDNKDFSHATCPYYVGPMSFDCISNFSATTSDNIQWIGRSNSINVKVPTVGGPANSIYITSNDLGYQDIYCYYPNGYYLAIVTDNTPYKGKIFYSKDGGNIQCASDKACSVNSIN